MTGQVLHTSPQHAELLDPRVGPVDTDLVEPAREGVLRVGPLEVVHDLGEPVDLIGSDRQHLADIACGTATAVGDDVGGHPGAQPAIPLVDMLDDPLPAVAARQVQIDIGPLAPLLRQKTLEESRSIPTGSTAVIPKL